jgi:two-component system nitrate/nitrite response regulator NarL
VKKRAKKIRLLLVDDHPVVREGIKSSLSTHPRIRIVAEASNGLEAVQKAKKHSPDVVLLDINMPVMGGLEAARHLRSIAPKSRILALTMHDNKEYVMEIARLGARGYILKDSSPSELARAIETVASGEAFFSPKASQHILRAFINTPSGASSTLFPRLSRRERQVLQLIAEGHTSKEIAQKLGITYKTAESHRDRIMRKLDIHSSAGLTKYAIAAGIVKLE